MAAWAEDGGHGRDIESLPLREVDGLHQTGDHRDEVDVHGELREQSARHGAALDALVADRCQESRHLRHRLRVAREHPDQHAVLGGHLRAGDGRLGVAPARGPHVGFEVARVARRDGAHLHDRAARNEPREVGCAAREHGVGGSLVDEHENDGGCPGEHFGRIRRDSRPRGAQGLAPGGGAVPHHELLAGAREVERHRLSHDAEADESGCHAPVLAGGGAARRERLCDGAAPRGGRDAVGPLEQPRQVALVGEPGFRGGRRHGSTGHQ